MLERRHSGQGIHLFGVLDIMENPAVASYIGDSREIRRQTAAFAFEGMTLAAAYREEQLFAVIVHGTA